MENHRMDKNALNKARNEHVLKMAFLELFDEEAERLHSQSLSPESEAEMRRFLARSQRKTLRLIRHGVRRENFKQAPGRSLAQIAAALILTVSIGGATAFAAIPEVRKQFFQFIMQTGERYTELSMQPQPTATPAASWQGEYYPTVIPQGMTLKETYSDSFRSIITYQDTIGRFFTFIEFNSDTQANFDTEDAQARQENINGHPALVSAKDGLYSITWSVSDRYFVLTSNLDEDTLLRIARGVAKKN